MSSTSDSTLHRVPVIHEVDVLVLGAGSGAVAAALEARQTGASVLAVSDRSYFGDESAGALRLAHQRPCDDPLFAALLPADAPHPPSPRHVKHQLEQALLEAGVPFLFYARPVALLRNDEGELCGAVLAGRTSLYGVGFRTVVDATRHGLLARLANIPLPQRRTPAATLEWIVLSPDAPQSEAFATRAAGPPFKITEKDETVDVPAHLLTFPRPEHDDTVAGRAALEHRLRAHLLHPTLWGTAETIPDHATAHLAGNGALADDPLALAVGHCQARPELLLMNSLLPLSAEAVEALDDPAVQVMLGRHVGQAAGALAQQRRAAAGTTDWSRVALDAGGREAAGPFGFVPAFVRPTAGLPTLALDFSHAPLLGDCDVLVAGGGTGGAPAGIAAARAGARTVVLEMQHGLGGVGTMGLIASYWFGNRVGFTRELDERVNLLMGRERKDHNTRWNPNVKDVCYQRALLDAGGSAWLGSFAFGAQREGDRVTGVLVSTPFGSGLLRTGAIVDATGSADVAAAAGAPCRVIDHRHIAVQGTGLAPRRPGAHYRNTDHTFVDDSDLAGVTHAFVNARAKFAAEFDVAPLVDSRERRQIHGDIELSPLDFLAKRTFPDTITTAMSNFDTHGFTIHPVFVAVPPDKKPLFAHVPFRCMLPRGLDGVLVTGLGMSAHRDALPVIRMQADVQNQGYAAGLASARSAADRLPLRQLDMRRLQRDLVELGVLDANVLKHDDSFPLPVDAVAAAVDAGPVDHFHAAVLVAHNEQSLPGLRKLLDADDPAKREGAALLLGLSGQPEAAPVLAAIVADEPWDDGWNFTGMGQFGRSMSRLDGLILALGKTRSPQAVEPVAAKIDALDGSADFSHCRAVSIAAAALADARLSQGLARLLGEPGVQGHAHLESAAVIRTANDDGNETEARNLSLRELLLARGLYLCGDIDGLGRRILETYARDLRGHYARHAQAVLAADDLAELRLAVM
ncbi:MAG: FAD-dependent oxidoreductase [Phycisphaeraceae bacterium]